MLTDKKLLLTGVITRDSIAWKGCPPSPRGRRRGRADQLRPRPAADRAGGQEPAGNRRRARARRQRRQTTSRPLASELRDRWGRVDGVLHAIAFAPGRARRRLLVDARRERDQPHSRRARSRSRRSPWRSLPLSDEGASIVGLDFDASVAWPVYDWMGVAKAALESVVALPGARPRPPRRAREPRVGRAARDARGARDPRLRRPRRMWTTAAPLGWDGEDREPGSGRAPASCCPTCRARSPARSCTSTAASTRWARRGRSSRRWSAPTLDGAASVPPAGDRQPRRGRDAGDSCRPRAQLGAR